MDSWDNDFGAKGPPTAKHQWEGEDEDETVKESWDDPEEALKDEGLNPLHQRKSREKVGEKNEKCSSGTVSQENSVDRFSSEEALSEKLQRQELQEGSDMSLPKEIFEAVPLETKEDFNRFKVEIIKFLSDAVNNSNYVTFTEELIHSLCLNLSSADVKKIHSWLGNLHIEKSKLEKGEKSKKSSKGKGKAKLKLEGNHVLSEYSAYTEDFDDFI